MVQHLSISSNLWHRHRSLCRVKSVSNMQWRLLGNRPSKRIFLIGSHYERWVFLRVLIISQANIQTSMHLGCFTSDCISSLRVVDKGPCFTFYLKSLVHLKSLSLRLSVSSYSSSSSTSTFRFWGLANLSLCFLPLQVDVLSWVACLQWSIIPLSECTSRRWCVSSFV